MMKRINIFEKIKRKVFYTNPNTICFPKAKFLFFHMMLSVTMLIYLKSKKLLEIGRANVGN